MGDNTAFYSLSAFGFTGGVAVDYTRNEATGDLAGSGYQFIADAIFLTYSSSATTYSIQFGSVHNSDQIYLTYDTQHLDQAYAVLDEGGKISSGGALVEPFGVSTPCFASGTQILTPRGEIAVEDLAVGDLVITSTGDLRPIRWLGHRTIDCRSNPLKAWPVRIARDAFEPCMPVRDLYVSPEHSLCVSIADKEVLIPAEKLINGTTVAFAPTDTVTYWHVELNSHEILLANGLPAESFLEMGANRRFFAANGDLDVPQDVKGRSHDDFCRPFHDGGLVVRAVRARLQARAELLGRCLDVPFSVSCPAARAAALGR